MRPKPANQKCKGATENGGKWKRQATENGGKYKLMAWQKERRQKNKTGP